MKDGGQKETTSRKAHSTEIVGTKTSKKKKSGPTGRPNLRSSSPSEIRGTPKVLNKILLLMSRSMGGAVKKGTVQQMWDRKQIPEKKRS